MKKITICVISLMAILSASCSERLKTVSSQKSLARNQTFAGLKIMTYNVHHCNPPSKEGLIDIDTIAKAIAKQNPDLLALQEIDVFTSRSGKVNQAQAIAKKLDMHYYFAKAIDYGGGEYGVAILSKFPMTDPQIHRLPTQADTKGEPRVLATAKITLPDGNSIRFGSTHLDAQKAPTNRLLQIKEINRISASETLPLIIAGDFNAEINSEVINELDKSFERSCQYCAPTIPQIDPVKTIDFIALRPKGKFIWKSTTVILETYASDHLPVVAELKIK